MIKPLSDEDLKIMRRAGKAAGQILKKIGRIIAPGISTRDIEKFFERELAKFKGMEPAFKGFSGYPASCCVSINEEIIHGIPSDRLIRDKDLVSVDLGIKYHGLYVDTAYTYMVGKAGPQAKKLLRVTQDSLYKAIKCLKLPVTTGDIGSEVQGCVEANGFSVIRRFVGHGIGSQLHLEPEVPNFGEKGRGANLPAGCAVAIEPMVSAGSCDVDILSDGWTAKTKDNSLSAHFEHTVAITKRGPLILTK